MPNVTVLNPEVDLDLFWSRLATAKHRLLLLDYDGTLAPFRKERNEAVPYPGVRELLKNMMEAQHSRIVIISGRATKDLLPLLGLEKHPEIWGSHGLEHLTADGSYEVTELDAAAENTLRKTEAWIREAGLREQSERKPGSVALHWRGMPETEQQRLKTEFREKWTAAAEAAGLALKAFDGGIELQATIKNKGDAVNAMLTETEEKETASVYLGDDFTDEDAFKALKGRGLSVLVREEFRQTAADIWLQPPEELLKFLRRWHETANN